MQTGHRTICAPELDCAHRYGNWRPVGAAGERRTVRQQSAVVAGSTMDRVRCVASGRTGECVRVSVPRTADSRIRVGGGGSLREPSVLVCGRAVPVLHAHGQEPVGSQRRSCAAVRFRIRTGGRRTDCGVRVNRNADARVPSRHCANRHARSDHPRARRLQGRRLGDGADIVSRPVFGAHLNAPPGWRLDVR